MINNSNLIKGGHHTDSRGTISFVNDFDMKQVKRFYIIDQRDTNTIRAWQAHRIEQRWFHVIDGEFLIRLVKIDNWESPSKYLPFEEYILSKNRTEVLHIPSGYASSIQANIENSKLIGFSDYSIEDAPKDDYRFPHDYFRDKLLI